MPESTRWPRISFFDHFFGAGFFSRSAGLAEVMAVVTCSIAAVNCSASLAGVNILYNCLKDADIYSMKWITREHPKIDRIACPWLIRRFVDKNAEIIYVPFDQVIERSKELN